MDRREEILKRMLAVLGTLKDTHGVKLCERNRLEASEQRRPAIVLLDSDEGSDDDARGRGRPAYAPNLIGMTPEIHVLVMEPPEKVGTELNTLRGAIAKAIMHDEELRGLVHDGDIWYEGCATGLSAGRSLAGEMALSFTLTYVFDPDEL